MSLRIKVFLQEINNLIITKIMTGTIKFQEQSFFNYLTGLLRLLKRYVDIGGVEPLLPKKKNLVCVRS